MNLEQLKAEIKFKLRMYEESGLLDDTSLNNWIRNGLKEFAGNIMEEEEAVIEVRQGKAKLPDNFYSLILAVKCDKEGYYAEDKETEKYIQNSYFYEERLEETLKFDNNFGKVPCYNGECKRVVQTVYFLDRQKTPKLGQITYNNIQPLTIKKGYQKQMCDVGCANFKWKDSSYEISVRNYNYIQTNFNNGYIAIRYKGLPVDEEGELIIPETHRGKLQEYLEYMCIRRALENVIWNSEDPNVTNKYNLADRKERETYQETRSELFAENLRGWKNKVKNQNRERFLKHEYLIPFI